MLERIQKILAARGVASRREAEAMIQAGRVTVNGVVAELGQKADPDKARLCVDGKAVGTGKEERVYVLLNKPKGYVSTVKDERNRKTVLDLVRDVKVRMYPVGRLDANTEGVLLLTNDGDLTHRLLHPAREIQKTYRAKVAGDLTPEKLKKLRSGLLLDKTEKRPTAPAEVRILGETEMGLYEVELVIHEGRNRQVRRMFQAVGCDVKALKRTKFAELTLEGVRRGSYRVLSQREVKKTLRTNWQVRWQAMAEERDEWQEYKEHDAKRRVIVVGAGAAGLFAGIAAAESGASVVLLEKMKRPAKKLMITGKGRCNITNAADMKEIIANIPGNGRFLHSVFAAYDNQAVMDFFESRGVKTKVERGRRVFPESDRAADVADALEDYVRELGGRLYTETSVGALLISDEINDKDISEAISDSPKATPQKKKVCTGVRLVSGKELYADAVIVATGGASYPATGSTGDGAKLARSAGHTIIPLQPSLVPLEVEGETCKELQGLSLKNTEVMLLADGKRVDTAFGEMLFTHFGVSGPMILSLSRPAVKALGEGKLVELLLNFKPALSREKLSMRVLRDFEKYKRKSLKNAMHDLLPARLIEPVLDAAYLAGDKFVHQVTKAERERIVDTLQAFPLTVTRARPLSEAIVTAGGVATKEISPKTMESKLVRNLYFAGEVVDVDGFTGGYNLQAAFSMGRAAGLAAAL